MEKSNYLVSVYSQGHINPLRSKMQKIEKAELVKD